jgi:hypothetical protein
MAERRKKRPRDPLALAKMIGDIATGQASNTEPDNRNPAAGRQNLSMRMGIRRFTRLTNAFSKKLENHIHALSI